MTFFRSLASVCTVASLVAGLSAAEPAIIGKARSYLGTEAALTGVISVRYAGTVVTTFSNEPEKPLREAVEIIVQKPDQQRVTATSDKSIEINGLDGYEGWQRVQDAGKDMSPYRAGFAQTIIVAESDAEAERDYRQHIDYFYNRCLHVYPGFADAPGYRTIKTLKANVTSQMTSAAVGDVSSMSWDQLVNQGYVIAGSPDTVVEKMKEMITGLRVGNIFCLIHVGDMPKDKCMRSTKLFAEEVMPRIRNMSKAFPVRACVVTTGAFQLGYSSVKLSSDDVILSLVF